ncbi:hypothetical protein [Deinococcus cellulosilyticus]|uniref:Uncharacterized protein n=1 Tax=Deinococcus cellulosilyticus (strain DSM 18568 / NBRC 106333 / KACC 11606 / 5516J-15) TaxID=1223518 RepID=A0A511MYG0_DEIC1|nr:hypothetical protein [Deinococcus cellulosilyticus]GEM45318.1 hypothetical protein DC3_09530 [Deinococcus cellulosilyticus NBRC 106333 = KACC 11606]
MAEQRVKNTADLTSLPPGAYRFEVRVKDPILKRVVKLVAGGYRLALVGDVWDKLVVPAIHQKYPNIKLPATNFVDPLTGLDKVGGKFRPRKGFEEATGEFWFWLSVVK